jgi:hypothetical protein
MFFEKMKQIEINLVDRFQVILKKLKQKTKDKIEISKANLT